MQNYKTMSSLHESKITKMFNRPVKPVKPMKQQLDAAYLNLLTDMFNVNSEDKIKILETGLEGYPKLRKSLLV